jgi:hypothetical protein
VRGAGWTERQLRVLLCVLSVTAQCDLLQLAHVYPSKGMGGLYDHHSKSYPSLILRQVA